jgi:hypothetical protein
MVAGGCYGCGTNTSLTSFYQPKIYGLINEFPYGAVIPSSDSGFVAALQTMFIQCRVLFPTDPMIIVLDATCESGFRCAVYSAQSVTGTLVSKSGRCTATPNSVTLGPDAAIVTSLVSGETGEVYITKGSATILTTGDIDFCPFYAGLVSSCQLNIGQSVVVQLGATVPYPLNDYLDCSRVQIKASETIATTRRFLQFVPAVAARFPLSGVAVINITGSSGGLGTAAGPGSNNVSYLKTAILAFLPGLQQNMRNMSTYLSAMGAIPQFVAGIKAEYATRGQGTNDYTGMDFLMRASSMINLYFSFRGNLSAPSGASMGSRNASLVDLGFRDLYPKDLFYNATIQQPNFPNIADDSACVYTCCTDGGYTITYSNCHEWRCDTRWNFNAWRYYYLRYLWISGTAEPALSWYNVTNSYNGRRDDYPPNAEPPYDWMYRGIAHIADMVMDDVSMDCNRLDPRWYKVTGNISWPGNFLNYFSGPIMAIAMQCYRFTNPELFQYSYVRDANCFEWKDHRKTTFSPIQVGGLDPSCNYYADRLKSPNTYFETRNDQVATQEFIVPPGLPPTAAGDVYFSPGMNPLLTCTDLDVMAYAYPFSLKYPLAMTTVLHSLLYLSDPAGTLVDDSIVPPVASAQAYVELAVLATMECNGYGDLMAKHEAADIRTDTPKIDICMNPPVSMHATDGSSPACAILYSQLVSNICGGDTYTLMGRWNASLNITSQMIDAGCDYVDRSATSFLGDPAVGLYIGVPDMGCASGIQCVPIPSPFGSDPLQYIRWGLVGFFYRMIAVQGVFTDGFKVGDFAEMLFPAPVQLVVPPTSSRPSQCYNPDINSTLYSKSIMASGVISAPMSDFETRGESFLSSGDVTINCAQ